MELSGALPPPEERDTQTAPKPLSLRRNFSWTFIANVFYAACQWGVLMLLAKLGSPEMVGQFVIALAVTAPIVMFANLQLRTVQATDAARDYRFGDYLALRLLTSTTAFLLICLTALLGAFSLKIAWIVVVMGAAKCFESISDVIYGLLQQRERLDRVARLMMFKGFVTVVAVATAIYLTEDLLWAAIGIAAAWGTQLLLLDLPAVLWVQGEARDRIRPRWNAAILVKLALLALPVGVVAGIGSLETNVPRYIIERYLGTDELGIFAAMSYLLVAGRTVTNAVAQSAMPRLSQFYSRGELQAFRKLLLKLLAVASSVGFAGILGALIGGEWLLTMLYTEEYAAYPGVFLGLMVAFAIRFSFTSLKAALRAMRCYLVQLPMQLILLVLLTGLSFGLIIPFGLAGAVVAVVTVSAVEFLVYGTLVLHLLRRSSQGMTAATRARECRSSLRADHRKRVTVAVSATAAGGPAGTIESMER